MTSRKNQLAIKGCLFMLLILIFNTQHTKGQCQIGDCNNGFGVRLYTDSSKFEGFFENGNKKLGSYFYKSGDCYEGEFEGNLRAGYGKYSYASGESFQGIYKDDKKEYGIYKYNSGSFYVGSFDQNKPDGFGTLYRSNGNRLEGIWTDGKPVWAISADSLTLLMADSSSVDYLPASVSDVGEKGSAPNIYAVIVGISDYQGYSADLRYAEDDAKIFYGYLKKAFQKEVGAGNIVLLLDEQATYSNIMSSLRRTFAEATENDYIMFYFSGHGSPGSFIPADHRNNQLLHSEVKAIFKSSKAKYRLCIADACFAGTVATSENPLSQYEAVQNLRDARLAVMMSSSSTQVSAEISEIGQGLFSYWLMKGIRGDADFNKDKYVTAGELFVYTRDAVYNQSAGRQAPVIIGQQLNRIPLSKIR